MSLLETPVPTWYDTIVIGTGISGLTAARLLAADGQQVVVLEARERIGGRVHSVRDGDRVTDLGASWIHGVDDGPLDEVTRACGMRGTEFTVGSFQVDGRPIAYYAPDARRLREPEASAFAQDVHDVDVALAATVAASAAGTSYGDAVEQTLAGFDWVADRAERVREFMRHRTEEQYGAWIDDLDAHGLDDDETNGDELVFAGGFDELATHLAAGLDVKLGHEVKHVHWAPGGGVRVESAQGVWSAKRAIVTVPVGVLQSGDFIVDPPLPEPVAGALARLTMNAFEKVVLRFDRTFWDEGVYAIRRQGEAATWWHSWYDLTRLHGEPSLLTFAAGPCAMATRAWSDERIAASVMASLREIYPDAPDPVHVLVSRWQDDPYSRGSYAYMPVGAHTEDHDLLAMPIGNGVLHLAGEATWTDDPATVTAAMCSGMRAATRVLGREVSTRELIGSLGGWT